MTQKYYIKLQDKSFISLCFLFLMIILGELVGIPNAGLSKSQEITVYIILIAAVLWITEWAPMFVVSFLILALEILWLAPQLKLDTETFKISVFYTAFFSNIILLFIGGFVLSLVMRKYGLDKYFAQKILENTRGNPSYTLLGVILTCSILSMWMSNTATAAMMLTIVIPIVKELPEHHPFRTALVLSIPFACNIGGIGTPIGTPPNAIALAYLTQRGIDVSFLLWMLMTLPLLIVLLFILWRLLLASYPHENIHFKFEKEIFKFGKKQYAAIGIFAATSLGWLSAGYLNMQTGTIALFPIIACFWFRLLDRTDFVSLPWDVLYIISGGMALGIAVSSSGLGTVVTGDDHLSMSMYSTIIIFTLTSVVMSTIMSNTATAALMIPLALSLNVEATSMITLVILIALSCSVSMMLPVTTPPNAIAFGSREISAKSMMISGGMITLISYVLIALFGQAFLSLFIHLI